MLEAIGDITATSQLSGLETKGPGPLAPALGAACWRDGHHTSTVRRSLAVSPARPMRRKRVIQITGVASRRVGYVMR